MSKRPKISVFSTVFNGEKYARETLDSIYNQTFTDFELVIVDGGSTDNTVSIIKEYKNKYGNINLIEHKCNCSDGFSLAIERSIGEYLMLCCFSDGYLSKTWFERCIEEFNKDKDISLVYGFSISMKDNGDIGNISYSELFFQPPPDKTAFLAFYLSTYFMYPEVNYCVEANIFKDLFRKSRIEKIVTNNLFQSFVYYFNEMGYLPKFLPIVANFGRKHDNSRTDVLSEMVYNDDMEYRKITKKYFFDLLLHKKSHSFIDRNGNILKKLSITNLLIKYILYKFTRQIYFTKSLNIFNLHNIIKVLKKLISSL